MNSLLKVSATLLAAAVWALSSSPVYAEEYIYRDLMANTLPSVRCLDKADAQATAQDAYLLHKKEKVFCETQGYGWNLVGEKTPGKLMCQACDSGDGNSRYQCYLQDIVVACKRIKPGSVGMIPGKG